MKYLTKIILAIIILSLVSCNSEGIKEALNNAGQNESSSSSSEVSLSLNVKTEVFSGQSYVAKSNDALIDVDYDETTGKKYVTLTQGEGAIITQ